jgi:membrane protein required for colicin V production
MNLAPLDWVLLAVLLVSAALGAWRGLVAEVLSVLAWVLSFLLAQGFAPQLAPTLPLGEAGEATRYFAAFALLFVLGLLACGLLLLLLKKIIAATGLRPIDRVLGGLFGLARGLVVLMALVALVGVTPLQRQPDWQQSSGVHLLAQLYHALLPLLPNEFARYLPE